MCGRFRVPIHGRPATGAGHVSRGLYRRLVSQPPPPITPELLASVAADMLPRTIFLRMVELIYNRGRDKRGQRAYVAALTPGLRMLWSTYELDSEVFNGGFHQYFFNDSRYYVTMALDGLAMLGADEHRALLNRAIDEVRAATGRGLGFDHPQWREHFGRAEVPPALEWLNSRYCDLPLLEPRQAAYIRAHLEQFVTD
jgi:Domain of unknown function (DUF4375)